METPETNKEYEFLEKALVKADELMKLNNGHDYITILKTTCQSCGRRDTYKGRCQNWFATFINKLKFVYLNPEILEESKAEVETKPIDQKFLDLADQLEKEHGDKYKIIIDKCRSGAYDDWKSELATPKIEMVDDLVAAGLYELSRKVMDGFYDQI